MPFILEQAHNGRKRHDGSGCGAADTQIDQHQGTNQQEKNTHGETSVS